MVKVQGSSRTLVTSMYVVSVVATLQLCHKIESRTMVDMACGLHGRSRVRMVTRNLHGLAFIE